MAFHYKIMTNKTFFETTIGSIFTLAIVQPSELLSAFIIGGAGAIGAFILGGLFKWLFNVTKQKLINSINKWKEKDSQ